MCTSIVSNRKKTIVGWNLDILDMEYKVVAENEMVYIAINDKTEGWLPLFGANARGDFVGMPTCHPYDSKSDPVNEDSYNIIMLDIDLLLRKKSLQEIKEIAEDDFDVTDCFEALKETSQTVCPTVVSMVYDVTNKTVYWCENRQWNQMSKKKLG